MNLADAFRFLRIVSTTVVSVAIAFAISVSAQGIASTPPHLVSVTYTNAPLRDVLLDLGHRFGVSIVVEQAIQGRVSANLHNATLDGALTAVLSPVGYTYHREGDIIVVGTRGVRSLVTPPPTPASQPAVLSVTNISVDTAASLLRKLFPHSQIAIDRSAHAVVVVDSAETIQAMRSILQGIDVQDISKPVVEAIQLHIADPHLVALRLGTIFRKDHITSGPNKTVLVEASPQDMAQIKAMISAIDAPTSTPPPIARPTEAVKIVQARPQTVAIAIEHEFSDVRAAVSGSSVLLTGPTDEVQRAKALVALIDTPLPDTKYTQVYRLRNVDARSVGDLIARSFHNVQVTVDADLNALSVLATAAEQQRIADAIAQLDVIAGSTVSGSQGGPPVQVPGAAGNTGNGPGGSTMQVITLKAAVPGPNQGASTTATDIATAVTQFLQPTAPDLHITVPSNSNQLMISGSSYTTKLARQLIDQLDVAPQQVVLDTEILEVDENVAKNLGLTFHVAALGTTYTELSPQPPPGGGTPPPLLGFGPVTRTPLSAQFDLNFLIQNGQARVLADPRITTISGHTASIRAGDTSYILTTTGGGVGTVATQQIQTFQTGVTLDITPVVNAGNSITVTLHPSVSSLAGTAFNLPQIATRDTQTTVTLRDNQTLIIGGLIQETTSRTDTKTPILGDIPIVGKLFHGVSYTYNRNELIIVVTPHILTGAQNEVLPGPPLPGVPTPRPLPTLIPGTQLPHPGGALPALPTAAPSPTPEASPASGSSAGQTNDGVFVFGSAPSNNFAGPTDAVTIYYATFSPVALHSGTLVQVSAITSTNVNRLTVGYAGYETQLAPINPGKFQAAFNFIADNVPVGLRHVQLTMTAYRQDGVSSIISIPVTIVP